MLKKVKLMAYSISKCYGKLIVPDVTVVGLIMMSCEVT